MCCLRRIFHNHIKRLTLNLDPRRFLKNMEGVYSRDRFDGSYAKGDQWRIWGYPALVCVMYIELVAVGARWSHMLSKYRLPRCIDREKKTLP